jgi:hypothetical protein
MNTEINKKFQKKRMLFQRKNIFMASRSGSALAYILIIMTVVSIILVSMLRYNSSQIIFSINRTHREEAFQIAESGIYFYRWYLAHTVSGKTVQQIKDFWQNGNPYGVNTPYEGEFSDPSGGVIGKYKIEVQPPDVNSTIIMVKSTGWTYAEPNSKRVVQVRFRRPSWSESAVVANDNMRFGQGTVVNGKIHSNKGIRFDGVATNIISSSLDKYDDPDHSGNNEFGVHTHVNAPPGSGVNNNFRPNEAPPTSPVPARADVFQAGRQFPVPGVDFNSVVSDLNFMKSEAQSGGRYFDDTGEGRRIILKTNGTFDICTVNSYDSASYGGGTYGSWRINSYKRNSGGGTCSSCSGLCLSNYPIPSNGIIFVEEDVWVEGTINNEKVTIAAADLIGGPVASAYIGINNILYTNTDGKDIIGIVAQKNISVVRDSQNILTVDAALLAQSGRVGRDWYPSSYDKNTITVNGSIATNQRYGFAWSDGTGYDTRNLNFDNNLLYYPPPYFPTGTEYYIDLWEEL